MSRRAARGGRREPHRSPSTPFDTVLALSTIVFTADRYVYDPVNNDVESWVDWKNPSNLMRQTDQTKRCAVPAPYAGFNGRARAVCTGGEYYPSNQLAAYWSILSNGSSRSVFAIYEPTAANNRLFSTRNASVGYLFGINNPTNHLTFVGAPAVVLGPGVSAPLSVPRMYSYRYTEGAATPEFSHKVTGFAAVTGDSSAAPSAGSPDGTAMLFANPDTTLPFVGGWAALVIAPDLGAADTARMQAALTAYYGVAA